MILPYKLLKMIKAGFHKDYYFFLNDEQLFFKNQEFKNVNRKMFINKILQHNLIDLH